MQRRKALATIGVVGVGSLSGCLFGGNDDTTDNTTDENQDTDQNTEDIADSVEEEPEERSYEDIWSQAVTNYTEHTSAELNLSTDWATGTVVTSEDPEYSEFIENGRLVQISNDQTRVVRYDRENELFYVDEETTFGRFQKDPPDFTEQSYQRELYYQNETLYGLITFPQTEPEQQWLSEPRTFDSVESDLLSLPQFPQSLPENATTNDTGATVEYEFTLSDAELLLNSVVSEGYYLSGVQQASETESTVIVTVNLETVQIDQLSIDFLGRTQDQFNESTIELEFDYGVSVDYDLPQSPSEAGTGEFYHPQR